jgi:Histone acetyltransferase subunit NuA4
MGGSAGASGPAGEAPAEAAAPPAIVVPEAMADAAPVSNGHSGASSPAAPPVPVPALDPQVSAALEMLKKAADRADAAVEDADAQVAELEDKYIAATWAHGNLMRGWDGYCRRVDRAPAVAGNGAGTATGAPKQRKLRPSDRMFSMTSATSAVRLDSNVADFGIKKGGTHKKRKKRV